MGQFKSAIDIAAVHADLGPPKCMRNVCELIKNR